MHSYDVHEVLYQNAEIHVLLVRGSGPRAGQYGQILKMYYIVKNSFSIITYILEKINAINDAYETI